LEPNVAEWNELVSWQRLFIHALASVSPGICLPGSLPPAWKYDRIIIVAVGKAACSMAAVASDYYKAHDVSGVAICPDGYTSDCGLEVFPAGHPVPDERSLEAADKALAQVASAKPGDLLLFLISGGGSALLCKPVAGVSFSEKQRVTNALLRSGAPIHEINTVRKYMSAIKAGGILGHANAGVDVAARIISDVVGDDIKTIASGLSIACRPTYAEASTILDHYNIDNTLPAEDAAEVKQGSIDNQIVANADLMLSSVKKYLEEEGLSVRCLGVDVEGEARDIAKVHAGIIVKNVEEKPHEKMAFVSGGELTVTVRGDGKGGPNQEYILQLLTLLDASCFAGLSVDTDGRDGTGGAAGAWFEPASHKQILDDRRAESVLSINDSYNYFNDLSVLFNVIPSANNVNDLRVIIYDPDKFQGKN
jgi:glycerate 2-kinase